MATKTYILYTIDGRDLSPHIKLLLSLNKIAKRFASWSTFTNLRNNKIKDDTNLNQKSNFNLNYLRQKSDQAYVYFLFVIL